MEKKLFKADPGGLRKPESARGWSSNDITALAASFKVTDKTWSSVTIKVNLKATTKIQRPQENWEEGLNKVLWYSI